MTVVANTKLPHFSCSNNSQLWYFLWKLWYIVVRKDYWKGSKTAGCLLLGHVLTHTPHKAQQGLHNPSPNFAEVQSNLSLGLSQLPNFLMQHIWIHTASHTHTQQCLESKASLINGCQHTLRSNNQPFKFLAEIHTHNHSKISQALRDHKKTWRLYT